jgi:hypothetical protein
MPDHCTGAYITHNTTCPFFAPISFFDSSEELLLLLWFLLLLFLVVVAVVVLMLLGALLPLPLGEARRSLPASGHLLDFLLA